MKKFLTTILLLTALSVTAGAQKITFMPQWTAQSQFAGYYLALEMGYYAQEGLDVEIRHIGVNSTESVLTFLAKGEVQIAGQQLMQTIVANADGMPLVNVMQLTQVSGLWCVANRPVSRPKDLDGLKVGRWKSGYADFCAILEAYNDIDIKWVPFINGINLFVYGAVDATLCYSFSEYISLLFAIGNVPSNHVMKFSDFGYDCPEDAVVVTRDYYEKHKDVVDKFVRATKKGWDFARTHRKEALDISMKYCEQNHVVTSRAKQERMLDEYLKLQVNPVTGRPDYAPVSEKVFEKVADALLSVGYITSKPDYKEVIR